MPLYFNELYVILLENVDEMTFRIRQAKKLSRTLSFSIGTKDRKIYRTINVSLTNFLADSVMQLSLFDTAADFKEENLFNTIDEIKRRFGDASVIRAISTTDASTLKHRSNLIAGHKK